MKINNLKKRYLHFWIIEILFIFLIPHLLIGQQVVTNKFTEFTKNKFVKSFCLTSDNTIWALVDCDLIKYSSDDKIKCYHLFDSSSGNLNKYEDKNINSSNINSEKREYLISKIKTIDDKLLIIGYNYDLNKIFFLKIKDGIITNQYITLQNRFHEFYDLFWDKQDVIWFHLKFWKNNSLPSRYEDILYKFVDNKLVQYAFFDADLDYLKFYEYDKKLYFLSFFQDLNLRSARGYTFDIDSLFSASIIKSDSIYFWTLSNFNVSNNFMYLYNVENNVLYRCNLNNYGDISTYRINDTNLFLGRFTVINDTLYATDKDNLYKISFDRKSIFINSKKLFSYERGNTNEIYYSDGLLYLNTTYNGIDKETGKDNFVIINLNEH
jgi:hypothetical protein